MTEPSCSVSCNSGRETLQMGPVEAACVRGNALWRDGQLCRCVQLRKSSASTLTLLVQQQVLPTGTAAAISRRYKINNRHAPLVESWRRLYCDLARAAAHGTLSRCVRPPPSARPPRAGRWPLPRWIRPRPGAFSAREDGEKGPVKGCWRAYLLRVYTGLGHRGTPTSDDTAKHVTCAAHSTLAHDTLLISQCSLSEIKGLRRPPSVRENELPWSEKQRRLWLSSHEWGVKYSWQEGQPTADTAGYGAYGERYGGWWMTQWDVAEWHWKSSSISAESKEGND